MTRRLETDPDEVEHDLVCLVLTVVELVRQLMERQALRRVDDGSLREEQIEAVGPALMRLDQAMTGLRERFGITEAELNPVGTVLPER
ncbi:gas vesicle protein K [Nonomuraea rosea]|uniref:Gas vesicle protein K n=1 Tax=Nonomuraea rosea TaxID=638574 RepID=A0ABP6VYG7_9ACTN